MKTFPVLLAVFVLLCASTSPAQQEIVFSAGGIPSSYQVKVLTPILREAFKRNNIRFKVECNPCARSLELSNSGQSDGELHRVHDFHKITQNQYPNLIRIDSQVLTVHMAVFAQNDIPVHSWEDIKGYTVAFQRGRKNVAHILKKTIQPEQIKAKNNDLIALRMLAEDRVGYVVSESFEGRRLIAQHPELAGVREVGRLKMTPIYSFIHAKHRELAKDIAATLEEMKRDGSFTRIAEEAKTNFLARYKELTAEK